MRLRLKNIKLRQQERERRVSELSGQVYTAEPTVGEIDVDELFDDDNPLQSWVETRAELDEPLFDPDDTTWAEGILDGDIARDPELRTVKRQREEGEGPSGTPIIELEPARHSDSRPVTPRMTGPPPSLRRSTSQITRIAREDPDIEKMKQIYVKNTPRGKGLLTKFREEKDKTRVKEEKQQQKSARRKLLVSYDDEDDDDDSSTDDDGATTGAAVGIGGTGFTAPSFSLHIDTDAQHSQRDESGEQGYYGHQSGYGGGQQRAGMYGWEDEYKEFQFDTRHIYGSSSTYPQDDTSSYSGVQSSQQSDTPRRQSEMQMQDFATSLFGYPAYRGYMQSSNDQQQPEDESDPTSSHYKY